MAGSIDWTSVVETLTRSVPPPVAVVAVVAVVCSYMFLLLLPQPASTSSAAPAANITADANNRFVFIFPPPCVGRYQL